MEMMKGPWTQEEDSKLRNCVTIHGEGHWTSLARSAGLNRSGKSCRLRWLNYLKPNVRRGNLTLQEQLLIIQLNLRIGNRWSQIAKYLPGRTDNEIKNYWRTKVKKQAKQLKCDVTSQKFKDTLRYLWMPRLVEQIHLATVSSSQSSTAQPITTGDLSTTVTTGQFPLAELLNAPNHEAPATEMFDSMVSTNCYASMRSNSSSNSVPHGIDCGLESAAAANSFASGEGQATEESEKLLSGEDWLDIFPDHQYDDIWDLPQMLYDEVYLN